MTSKSYQAIEVRAFGAGGRRRAGRRFTANWSDPIPVDQLSEGDRVAIEADPNLAVREVTVGVDDGKTDSNKTDGGKPPPGKAPDGTKPPAK